MGAGPPFGAYAPSLVQRALTVLGRGLGESWLERRLAAALRSLARRVGRPVVDQVVDGVKFRFNLTDNACERRLFVTPQLFDPQERARIKELLTGDVHFIDVGANVGAYSLFAAHGSGNGANVIAIEPQPGIRERLETNIRLNGFAIDVVPVAVGRHAGTVEMTVDVRNRGNSSLDPERRARGGQQRIAVEIRPLADIVAERGWTRVDIIKVDIEGHEDDALIPYFEQAGEQLWPRLLLIENATEGWRTDLLAALAGWGYREVLRTPANIVLQRSAVQTSAS